MALDERDSPSSGKSKLTSTAELSLKNTGRPSPVTTTSRKLTGDGLIQLTCFAADHPVNHSHAPGSDWAQQMTEISGRKLLAQLPTLNHDGSFLKMLVEAFPTYSSRCFLNWRGSAIRIAQEARSSRYLFQLVASMPRTSGSGYGLWPTPVSSPTGSSVEAFEKRQQKPSSKHRGMDLTIAAMMWPTPTAMNNGGGSALNKWGGSGARKKLRKMVTPQELNGALNPQWVEWLMGYPIGWTDLKDSATPSSHRSRKR